MSFFKIDLQEDAWLDQIFLSRNQAYGAFQIRKAYTKSSIYGLGIALLLFGTIAMLPLLIRQTKVIPPISFPDDSRIIPNPLVFDPPKPPSKSTPKVLPPNRPTIQSTIPVITTDPVKPKELPPSTLQTEKIDLGSTTKNGKDSSGRSVIPEKSTFGEDGNSNEPLRTVENPAEYPGGLKAITEEVSKYLKNHYPEKAIEEGDGGRVLLQFIVERNGEISDIKVLQGDKIGGGIPEVAVKAIKQLNRFKPGMQNGHAVRQYFLFPITFQVQERDN